MVTKKEMEEFINSFHEFENDFSKISKKTIKYIREIECLNFGFNRLLIINSN